MIYMREKISQKHVTTFELDPEDNAAITEIQAYIKAEYPLYQRGSEVPKRVAISWAIRKVAEELRKNGSVA